MDSQISFPPKALRHLHPHHRRLQDVIFPSHEHLAGKSNIKAETKESLLWRTFPRKSGGKTPWWTNENSATFRCFIDRYFRRYYNSLDVVRARWRAFPFKKGPTRAPFLCVHGVSFYRWEAEEAAPEQRIVFPDPGGSFLFEGANRRHKRFSTLTTSYLPI